MLLRTPRDVGLAIRDRRRALGLGQAELAERVGVSRQWIIEAEKGKRRAALWLVLRTLDALGIVLRSDDAAATTAEAAPAGAVDIGAVIDAHRGSGTSKR